MSGVDAGIRGKMLQGSDTQGVRPIGPVATGEDWAKRIASKDRGVMYQMQRHRPRSGESRMQNFDLLTGDRDALTVIEPPIAGLSVHCLPQGMIGRVQQYRCAQRPRHIHRRRSMGTASLGTDHGGHATIPDRGDDCLWLAGGVDDHHIVVVTEHPAIGWQCRCSVVGTCVSAAVEGDTVETEPSVCRLVFCCVHGFFLCGVRQLPRLIHSSRCGDSVPIVVPSP